ncbi:hypothetical protein, partial [Arenimonas donghaensis]|uniref:hypothetical protein n=1 Tax=Arenimonas donghaensis TaxID=375061 RepID=UPI001B80A576
MKAAPTKPSPAGRFNENFLTGSRRRRPTAHNCDMHGPAGFLSLLLVFLVAAVIAVPVFRR